MDFGLRKRGWAVTAVILTAATLLADLPRPLPQMLAFLLLAVWPMAGWWRVVDGRLAERLVSAAALAMLVSSLVMLAAHYVPGSVSRPWLMVVFALAALLPQIKTKNEKRQLSRSQQVRGSGIGIPDTNTTSRLLRYCEKRNQALQSACSWPKFQRNWHWVFLILLALALRFTWLGYSEFQGDEGLIMSRAAAMLTGDDAEIFLHQKGPIEILLPMSLWGLAGEINEFWARIAFAWAGVWAVLAVAALTHHWFGTRAGWLAGVLFAMMGFSVAFGRIVQYQSLVMLWGTLAVWHAVSFRERGRRLDLGLTAVFLAGGLLAHYDAVLVVPAIAWAVWPQLRPFDWRAWLGATAVGVLVLALFYVPFVLDPNFSRTGQYLWQGRIGADADGRGLLSWSGTAVWQMVTFYNTLYYVVGLVVALLIGLMAKRRQQGTALLLFAAPFLFYLFIVADPRTHVYTFFPGAVILAAVGLDWLLTAGTGWRRLLLWGGTAVWLTVSLAYVWLMFVDHTPERQRTWAENRPRFYPVTWEKPPEFGLFGFPHQAGWRVASSLVGETDLPFASNEEQEVTAWYMAPAARTHCPNFETFLLAANAQDELPVPPGLLTDWLVQAEVQVNGRPSLWVYGRQPVAEPVILQASDYSRWLSPAQAAPMQTGGAVPLDVTLGDGQARLVGYDLDASQAVPGGQVVVTLYWVGLRPFDRNFQSFVHLFDGELRAQHDGAPDCAVMPTTRWEPGQLIADAHVVPIAPDVPAGEVAVLVGMYDLLTLERLAIPDRADQTIYLTSLPITDD